MDQQLTKQQIDSAVEFWAEQVQHPQFRTLSSEERRQRETEPAAMAEMMASMLAKEVPGDAITAIKKILKQRLSDFPPGDGLHVDYAPEEFLSLAGTEAGIPQHNWPWKTNMWFEDGETIVSCGYGGKRETLPKKG